MDPLPLLRVVKGGLEIVLGPPASSEMEQRQPGEDAEGGDDDVLAGLLQSVDQVNEECIAGSERRR